MQQQGSDNLIPAELRPKLVPVARKVFWWGTPEEWVADGKRFLAQVMTYADWDTARATLALVGETAFKRALEDAPPGVFDARSWHYWHSVFKMTRFRLCRNENYDPFYTLKLTLAGGNDDELL